ncbi:MAG: N-glycosylase/DNA lyase [Deferribacteres bacterium]|nr:N-glycosylase/DNA lyase [Deferribacteres bacterium]
MKGQNSSTSLSELLKEYEKIKPKIEERVKEFQALRSASEERILLELIFCLLTPQSKATVCWKAAENIYRMGFDKLSEEEIKACLKGVRFKNNKAKYIKLALKKFLHQPLKKHLEELSAEEAREWLVKSVKGMGYKEASHFLRNTGFGLELAILDRHILKNLEAFGAIEAIPKTLTRKRYLEIEKRMREFAGRLGIDPAHLDLLLWYKETGFIFK